MLTPEQINQIRAQDKLAPIEQVSNPVNNIDRAAELQAAWGQDRKTERTANRSLSEKVLDFTGGKEIAQGLGQALNMGAASKQLEETQKRQFDQQGQLLKLIKEGKAAGKDVSRLEKALGYNQEDIDSTVGGAEQLLNPNELTSKQVIGDALQLATTAAGGKVAGSIAKGATATGAIKGALQGAGVGAATGATLGGATGFSQGLQDDKSIADAGTDALTGAALGGVTGGVLGALTGGISGGLKGRALRKEVLGQQVASGEKIKSVLTPVQQKAMDMAKQQGFDDVDIEFVQTMKPTDRVKAQKMIDLAQKASTNKRAIERPIDVAGDSMLDRIKFIQKNNSKAGKAVDTTAKSLKGQLVDAVPVRERALSLLEDAGVTSNADGTPNWSKSIFSKTPELEKKLMKSLSDLPAGEMDAYDLHNFKKSIDEVVDYGVGGEGLKGKSASILKAIRNSADDILDSNFKTYNKANTDFKVTREVLDATDDLFGKKAGLSKERGGQLLRSVFSNNTQRPRVMQLLEQLDKTAKAYKGKFDDNLVDQALFTEILEDIYGTQATTSLQGQVGRAVKGAQAVIEGVKNPIQGIGNLAGTIAEKSMGISDENKKKVLSALLK